MLVGIRSAILKSMNRIPLPTTPAPDVPGSAIDYELFLDCVHCGLCTAACPTYLELGTEMDSPRGRIYLMRGVVDGRIALDGEVRRHLDLCLDCRACETACPSGVKYGHLIEPFRVDLRRLADQGRLASPRQGDAIPWWMRLLLFRMFPYRRWARLALAPARLMQWLGMDRWLESTGLDRWLPSRVRELQRMLPPPSRIGSRLAEVLPPLGPRRARVALFVGCVADVLFADVNWMTARVLQQNGCEVWVPRAQGCCGALHYHAGMEGPALQFARKNLAAFLADSAPLDAIVVNVAGCGAMLKDYGTLLSHAGKDGKADKVGKPLDAVAAEFSAKVRDIHEFLWELGPVPPANAVPMTATYHDACHLCHAQKIRHQPRALLGKVPGLKLVPLEESEVCCGAAGSYNLTQPEMAKRLGRRKADHILATQAEAVLTGNAGCLMQIRKHLRDAGADMAVAHPVEVLWWSYEGTATGIPPWRNRR